MSKPAGHALANIRAADSLRSTLVSCGGGEEDRRDGGKREIQMGEKIRQSEEERMLKLSKSRKEIEGKMDKLEVRAEEGK